MPDETRRFELVSELAHALSLLNSAHSAINRIYDRDRGRYFAAAQKCAEKNSPALRCGRAEHQIMGMKALGILADGDEKDISLLLRSAMRGAYDALQRVPAGTRVKVEDYLTPADRTDNSDVMYAKIVAIMGICAVRHLVADQTPCVGMVLDYINQRKVNAGYRRQGTRSAEAVRVMRDRLGTSSADGITGLYDGTTDALRGVLDDLLLPLNIEGIDSGVYTAGVGISSADADLIASADDAAGSACLAALLLLSRAIRRDRDFCFDLYRDSRDDQIFAARNEANSAKAEAAAAQGRVADLERIAAEQARELDKLRRELTDREGDAAELSALRSAVYAASRFEDGDFSEPEKRRAVPEGVVVIGGHPTWAKLLQDACPVRVWPTGTTCPPSVVSSAREVWIQAAYMSHTEFYAAITQARRCNIPVHYFSSTGVARCVSDLEGIQE